MLCGRSKASWCEGGLGKAGHTRSKMAECVEGGTAVDKPLKFSCIDTDMFLRFIYLHFKIIYMYVCVFVSFL